MILFFYLLFLGFVDWFNDCTVEHRFIYPLILLGLLLNVSNWWVGLLFFLVGYWVYFRNGWGGSDTLVIAAIGLFLGFVNTLYFLIILCLLSLPYFGFVRKFRSEVPFLPCFVLAYIIFLVF